MKHTILNWILGASLVVATPVAMADNNWKKNNHHAMQNAIQRIHKHHNKLTMRSHTLITAIHNISLF